MWFYLQGSWETAFKHRFKNIRKKGRSLTLPSLDINENMKIDSQQAKKRKVEECITMPEGETEETCKEHIEVLKKEMARKTNRNMAVVKELMALTFAYRRTAFLKGTMSVGECLESYPALKLPSTVSCSSLKLYKIGTKLFFDTYLTLTYTQGCRNRRGSCPPCLLIGRGGGALSILGRYFL